MADMDCYHIRRVALVYLYLNNKRRRRQTRRRVWVHHMSQGQFGEFHRLLQELRLDEGRFQWYFRLSTAQFDDLLSRIGARITHQDTNYRRSISAAERLSVCLRSVLNNSLRLNCRQREITGEGNELKLFTTAVNKLTFL